MKKSRSCFVWVAVLAVSVGGVLVTMPSVSAAGQPVYIEDFEDGNTDGWESSSGVIAAVDSPVAPNGGSYVGRVSFGSSCWGPSTGIPVVAADSVSWYFRADGDTAHASGVAFGIFGSPGGLLALISYHNGLLRYRDDETTGTYLTLQPASVATWYLIELSHFDWDAGTYDIWVDGVERAVGAPFMAPDLVGVRGMFNYACPTVSGPSYLDDLTVSVADVTAPTAEITTPADQADYKLGEVVLADYACSDDGSGVASCDGPVPVGDPIDTSTLGPHQFSVTATDVAGNQVTVTHSYTVSAVTPVTKADCKQGGWKSYTNDLGTPFANQGACVGYVAASGKSKAKG